MLQYTLKRLLLILPTFFAISLLIFLVLNIAPGRPGEIGEEMGESAGSSIKSESFRIFKEQFGLDKPILFNTRFLVDVADVRQWIQQAHGLVPGVSAKERVAATDKLDDYGNRLVEPLVALIGSQDEQLARWASVHLAQAAQLRYRSERRGDAERARAANREIRKINERLRTWYWDEDTPAAQVASIKQRWVGLRESALDCYAWSWGENLHDFFFDTRFANYWSNLLHLDFGVSNVDRRPVMPTILAKMKYSLSLTLVAVLLAYLVAVPIGIYSAVRAGTTGDALVTIGLFVLYSLPTFFTGTVLLRLLSEGDPWAVFPTGGFEDIEAGARPTLDHLGDVVWHLVLPVVTYAAVALAALSRYARAGVIDVIRADYIRTARAKGLSEPVVIIKHAARNGMIPILTLLGGLLPLLVSGSVVIEVIFNIPGMGLYLFDSINLRDYNAVMGVLLLASMLTLFGVLLSDLSYALADPRISLE